MTSELVRIGEPAVPKLIETLRNENSQLKIFVMHVLAQTNAGKHRQEVVDELLTLAKDRESSVKLAAIRALASLGSRIKGEVKALGLRPSAEQEPKKIVRYAKSLIAKYDTDGNGVLVQDEWRKSSSSHLVDQNNDGRITLEELVANLSGPGSR
jgi:Ca2+-binding EF-hand superfamily protein